MSSKQKAFWDGATVGAIIATPAAAIATQEQDEDDRYTATVIGMVAGGIIGGVVGLMNAKESVAVETVTESVPAPKAEPAPAPAPRPKPAPPTTEEPPMVTKAEPAPAPAPPAVQEKQAPPPEMKVREKIVLRGINFDFDKANIKPEFVPVLEEAARILAERPEVSVAIGGHTCWIGTDAYNQGLSERRANSVYDFLVKKGISPERLITVGYGESQPVADNRTLQGRRLNRRVEFSIIDK